MSDLTIGKLAKSASVGVETVRFYERMGLIKRPAKKKSGFRHYDERDVLRIRFIKRAQELGYTLREIKELFALEAGRRVTCGDYTAGIESKLKEIDEKIRDLKRIKKKLTEILAYVDENPRDLECRLSECFDNNCGMPQQTFRKAMES